MIRDYQAIQRTWFLKGRQRIIPTYGKHCGTKLIGCLDYETGEILCSEKEQYDATSFLEFLVFVLDHYPVGKIVMILDNVRIHHAKLIQPLLEENECKNACNHDADEGELQFSHFPCHMITS